MQWARRFRLPLLPSQTPNEQAALLIRVVPEGRPAIQSITEIYVQDLYSPTGPDERMSQEAVTAWGGLQPVLRRAWLRARLRPSGGFRLRPKKSQDAPAVDNAE